MPFWLETFLFIACAVLFVLIPARVLWKMYREESEETRKTRELASRLNEVFQDVSFSRIPFSPSHVFFRYRDRPFRASLSKSNRLTLRLDESKLPSSPFVIRSKSGADAPFRFEGWRWLGRCYTEETGISIYGSASLGPPSFAKWL